jgi:ribosome biogenesis protein MAK21
VYKNPKKPKPRGASAMQPAASIGYDGNATVRRMKGGQNDGLGPGGTVNDEEFWRKKVQDVPATQVKLFPGPVR